MPTCKCCHKFFEADDFMTDNLDDMDICPDCYYGGGMLDEDDANFDDADFVDFDDDDDLTDDCDEQDSAIIREFLDEDEFSDIEDLGDYDDRLELEEGDYEV